MIDFCYRALPSFAFLVVSRVFSFPQTDDRGTLRKLSRVLMMMKRTPRMNEFRFCCTDRVRAFEREFTRESAVARDSLNASLVSSSVRKRSALSRLSASL